MYGILMRMISLFSDLIGDVVNDDDSVKQNQGNEYQ
jgi:hypothetical protein